ncbi:hypothetical protein [Bacillus sp. FJAT-49736]|uniref:hypothetical protein n=1 Tax=Bacillus sp. FJAT-49736 TaxID=2833582 RepID=UPI001BC96CE5|nr:hypothetical protein [Bacillus sp. FJAT-49736]MBS4174898.1 hypothetical protein [Bacillus sp. FJAT-49736]
MLTLTSIDELKEASNALIKLQTSYPSLFEKLVHIVGLTRALQFKYDYMGNLILDENPSRYSPQFVQSSVLRLYRKELQALKDDVDFPAVKHFFANFKDIGSAKLGLLILGKSPESVSEVIIK